jgi:hypothetical protein
MAHQTAPQAQIDHVVELMEEAGIDLYDLLLEVFMNWNDAQVLALLPAERTQAALTYLQQQAEPDEEEPCAEYIDLSE